MDKSSNKNGFLSNLKYNEDVKPKTNFMEELNDKMPEFITKDGEFDLYRFKEKLKESNINELNNGYKLDFVGKNYARAQAGKLPDTVIVPDINHNNKSENIKSENLFFTGDNLDVLRHLKQNYKNSIDFIYIDPPYNTGKDDFVYPDKFEFSDEKLKKLFSLNDEELKKLKSIQKRSSHSAWLTFIYPRLMLAHQLLSETGVIFISIDDNEQANLKLIMDEIFGENNFLGEIVWQSATDNNASQISIQHEYIIGYSRNIMKQDKWKAPSVNAKLIKDKYEELKSILKTPDEIQKELRSWITENKTKLEGVSHYSYVDEKGVYYPGNPSNTKDGDYKYEIVHPVTKKITNMPKKGWRWPKETFIEAYNNGEVEWGENETTIPRIKKRIDTATDLLKSVYYEDNRYWSSYVSNLIGGDYFTNPKSVSLIKKIIKFSTSSDSIILDFFAGSGTTAEAVMSLNKEQENSKRRYIMVQLPEKTKTKLTKKQLAHASTKKNIKNNPEKYEVNGDITYKLHPAYLAGFNSIDKITRKRIIEAAKHLNDLSGFKHYSVEKLEVNTLDKMETFNPDVIITDDLVGDIQGGVDTLLTTWMVKDGFKFNEQVEKKEFAGSNAYYIDNSLLYIFDNNWGSACTKELLNQIGNNKLNINTIIVNEYALSFNAMTELKTNIKILKDRDFEIKVEVRN
ncbi:hypothetical protein A4A29_13980 [Staphylococcus equorum]|nr:hypothetical protein A4A29_13980 [Staphylococcus equorum]